MAYTTINKHTDYFNTKLYTGNGSVRTETGVGFQPDLTWIKDRTGTNAHVWTDAVRGANYQVYSNLTNAQTNASGYLTAFASDGFTLGTDGAINQNSSNYVAWNWKAGGSGSANTSGSTNSTVSVNTTAGFSIVSYTGTGSNATIGHGLGVAPKMIIIKNRSQSNGWIVGHEKLDATNPWHKYMELNSTNAAQDLNTIWNDTAPTSTLFTVGTEAAVNNNGNNFIAYCFAEKTGYSRIGKWRGNGNADGTFVYTGFAPKFLLLKKNGADGWWLLDDKMANPYPNSNVRMLVANTNGADNSSVSPFIDIYSNGFKLKSNWDGVNADGSDYIYMAIGQTIVGTNNIATVAR